MKSRLTKKRPVTTVALPEQQSAAFLFILFLSFLLRFSLHRDRVIDILSIDCLTQIGLVSSKILKYNFGNHRVLSNAIPSTLNAVIALGALDAALVKRNGDSVSENPLQLFRKWCKKKRKKLSIVAVSVNPPAQHTPDCPVDIEIFFVSEDRMNIEDCDLAERH